MSEPFEVHLKETNWEITQRSNGFFRVQPDVAEGSQEEGGLFGGNTLRQVQLDALKALRDAWAKEEEEIPNMQRLNLGEGMTDENALLKATAAWMTEVLKSSYSREHPPWKEAPPMIFDAANASSPHNRRRPDGSVKGIKLPTGTGKTVVLGMVPLMMKKRPSRVLVVGSGREIVKELSNGFLTCYAKYMPEVEGKPRVLIVRGSTFSSAKKQNAYDVYIGTYQALSKEAMLLRFPRDFFDLMLLDEGHHAQAQSYQILLEYFCLAKCVLVTATPYCLQDMQLVKMVYQCSLRDAASQGLLKKVRYAPVPCTRLAFGDSSKRRVLELTTFADIASSKQVFVESVQAVCWAESTVEDVLQLGLKKLIQMREDSRLQHQMLIQAKNQKHAKFLFECLETTQREAGLHYVSAIVDTSKGDGQNKLNLGKLRDGKIEIVIHVGMIGEGFNCPLLTVCCLFWRFGSLTQLIQLLGRVIRLIPSLEPEREQQCFLVAHPALGLTDHIKDMRREDKLESEVRYSLRSKYTKMAVVQTEADLDDTTKEEWIFE